MRIDIDKGESFYQTTQRAIKIANAEGIQVDFTFNEIEIRVYPGSHEFDIAEKYDLKNQIRRLKKGYRD